MNPRCRRSGKLGHADGAGLHRADAQWWSGNRPARRHLPGAQLGWPAPALSRISATTSPPPVSTTARPIRWGASGPAPCTSRVTRARPSCIPSTCASPRASPDRRRPTTRSLPTAWRGRPMRPLLYWADTTNHVINAWDWEPRATLMRPHRVFQQFPCQTRWLEAGRARLWRPSGRGRGGRRGQLLVGDVRGPRLLQALAPPGHRCGSSSCRCAAPPCPVSAAMTCRTLYVTSASYNRPARSCRPCRCPAS